MQGMAKDLVEEDTSDLSDLDYEVASILKCSCPIEDIQEHLIT